MISSTGRDSNPRPFAYRATALAAELPVDVVGAEGIEPSISRSRTVRDTTSLHPDAGGPSREPSVSKEGG